MDAATRAKTAMSSLKVLLERFRVEDAAGRYFSYCFQRANTLGFHGGLVSPARQGDVFLSVLLSTPEPPIWDSFGESEWKRTIELLNEAFLAYRELFWPREEDLSTLSDEWRHIRSVAMPAFMQYFNTGLLASPQQISDRVTRYIAPFDALLLDAGFPTATSALEIAEWASDALESRMNDLSATMSKFEDARTSYASAGSSSKSLLDRINAARPELAIDFVQALRRIGTISKGEMVSRFGEAGERFWNSYSISRGNGAPLQYPTDLAIAASRPLIRLDFDRAMIPVANTLFSAILGACEQFLSASSAREKFFAHRDKTLERESSTQFARLTDSEAIQYQSVFETPDSQREHDLVIVSGDAVFIVESKASPPTEPFRDPERAFNRLRRSFNSDSGIQKAFEQAESVRRRLESNEAVELFDSSGTRVVLLDPAQLTRRYSIVVTRDNFGALATDLSLLLQKDQNVPYPWAVNVLDLCALADAWDYLGWSTNNLEAYLASRLPLNGKVFTADELEIAGFHIVHGSLDVLARSEVDRIGLTPSYSDYFDHLFRYKRYGIPMPLQASAAPVMIDLRASLAAGGPVTVIPPLLGGVSSGAS